MVGLSPKPLRECGNLRLAAQCHRWSRKIPAVVIAAVVSSIASMAALAQSTPREHPFNSVREIRAGLRRCWVSPPMRIPPKLTVRLSLKRNGEILGQPLISYTSPDTSEDERAALHAAVVAANTGTLRFR